MADPHDPKYEAAVYTEEVGDLARDIAALVHERLGQITDDRVRCALMAASIAVSSQFIDHQAGPLEPMVRGGVAERVQGISAAWRLAAGRPA